MKARLGCTSLHATFVALFALQLVLAGPLHASSVLMDFAPNHTKMNTTLDLVYEDIHGLGTADVSSIAAPPITANPFVAPQFDSIANPPDLFPAFSSVAKDAIKGQLDHKLNFGVPVVGATFPDDTFRFYVSGFMSAVDAHNSFGYASDAKVHGKAVAEFYIDAAAGGAPSGVDVGFIAFPDMALGLFDKSFEIIVTELDPVTGIINANHYFAPHLAFNEMLMGDRYYTITQVYDAEVPHGVDPPYALDYAYSLHPLGPNAVPEPAAIGIIVLGLMFVGMMRRRRSR